MIATSKDTRGQKHLVAQAPRIAAMIALSFLVALLSLTPVTVAGPLYWFTGGGSVQQKRQDDVAAIQSSINNIANMIATANNSVVAFQGSGIAGLTGLANVNEAVVQLGNAETTTINLESTMPMLSPTDS